MKKSFLLAAFAGILLAGCTSDEQTEVATSRTDNPIVFNSPIVNAQTRAVAGEQPVNGKYSTLEKFCVYAVQHIGDFQGWANGTQLYLDNLEVSYNANIVGTTQSAISHQLRLLKQSKLVKFRREGKVIFYSLDDDHIAQIVKKGSEHIEEL